MINNEMNKINPELERNVHQDNNPPIINPKLEGTVHENETPPITLWLLLEEVYRFTTNQADKVIEEGYDSITEFIYWCHEDI